MRDRDARPPGAGPGRRVQHVPGEQTRQDRGDGPVVEQAHAKLNLTLEVLGKRQDGYHDLASVMQTVELHDDVAVEDAARVEVICDDPALLGEANLGYRAAESLRSKAGVRRGARITVTKRIPLAAGLGGGSADAAATLRALNRLWDLGLSLEELSGLGAAVGSDVPFLVHEGTALVRGRGEQVTLLPPASLDWLIVLCPVIQLDGKTGRLFSQVTPDMYTLGDLSHKLAGRIRGGGDVPAELMFNVFDRLAPKVFPGWTMYRDALTSLGAREVILAGAGPSMFAKAPRKELGTAWQLLLEKQRGWRVFLTRPWQPAR